MGDGSLRSNDKYISGEEFKLWRRTRGLTQQEVGKWMGVTYQAIQQWEINGLSRIQALALSAVERGLRPWTPNKEDLKDEEPKDGSDDS